MLSKVAKGARQRPAVFCFCLYNSYQAIAVFSVIFVFAPLLSAFCASPNLERSAQVDVSKALLIGIKNYRGVKYLGLTNDNQFIVALNQSALDGLGRFYWIDARRGKVKKSIPSNNLDSEGVILSSDGKILFAFDEIALLLKKAHGEYYVHSLDLYRSSDMRLLNRVDIGHPHDIMGLSCIPNYPDQILIKVTSLLPYQGDTALLDDRLEVWDWKTSHLVRRINYSSAREISQTLFSPDLKFIACVLNNNNGGDSGIVDIIDAKTGKICWHISGNDQLSVDAPFFYLPDGRFVTKNNG